METMDLTPTWAGLLPGLIAQLDNGTVKSRKTAEAELRKMAGLADRLVAAVKDGTLTASGVKPFSVAVDSEDYNEGEWIDTLIVLARDEREARDEATDYVATVRDWNPAIPMTAEAYALDGASRVVGRLINTSEE